MPEFGPLIVRKRHDTVVKGFCAPKRAILIQDQAPIRNVDSKSWSRRFDCCVEGAPRRLLQQYRHTAADPGGPHRSRLGGKQTRRGHRETDADDPSETLVVRRNDLYPRSTPTPFQVLVFVITMSSPEPGVGHEAMRISRCARRRGGVAARGARADQRKNPANWSFVARSQHRGSGYLPRR
jgi:hypothetical protein